MTAGPFSTSAVIAQTSNATFQAWVQEVYTNWVTNGLLTALPQLMDTGQMAVPCATAVPGAGATSAGYYMFAFNDPLAAGPISTTVLGAGGSGYDAGGSATFTAVPLTGGSGTGAKGTIVVTAGVAANATITTPGTGYQIGDTLSASNTNLGGSGSGLVLYVNKLTSAASPVVMKVEFGSGSVAANPQMWITIGSGWTSNGTLNATSNGALSTRVACLAGGAIVSTVTAYTSRYNWNSALGYLGLCLKIGATSAGVPLGGLVVFRVNDNGGNVLSNGVVLITNSVSATGVTGSTCGAMQCMSYTSNVTFPAAPGNTVSQFWSSIGGGGTASYVLGMTSTLENSTAFVTPIYTVDPVIRFSAYNGIALATDFPQNNTASFAMVGSSALTFISTGSFFGSASGFAGIGSTTNNTFCMLWQ